MVPARSPSVSLFVALAAALPALAQTRWNVATPTLPFSSASVATYDMAGQRAIVVNQPTNTTWALSSVTGTWTMIVPQHAGPGWIFDTSLAFDEARHRAVLFGGSDFSGNPLNTTWELVGSAWRQVASAVVPPARRDAGMCFDAAAGVVRMAGGDAAPVGATPIPLADVWTFDGTVWTALPSSAAGPAGPTAMAYDTTRDRCVALAANGTFEWRAGAFAPMTGAAPPPRRSPGLVYDTLRERMVLFGGSDGGAASRGDVWEYDGTTWTQRQPFGLVPRRERHAMVYDPELDVVRVFAGVEVTTVAGGAITTSVSRVDELQYGMVSPPLVWAFAQACYYYSVLSVDGLPWLGSAVGLSMPYTATGLPPLMVFGASNERWGTVPLPLRIDGFGFPNCDLVVAPDLVLLPAVAGSTASLTLPIPNRPGLLGARLYVQGFEPSPSGAGSGTQGLLLRLGSR